MNWYGLFYLLGVADKVEGVTLTLAIISSIISVVMMIIWMGSNTEGDSFKIFTTEVNNGMVDVADLKFANRYRRWWSGFIICTVVCWFSYMLIPDKRDIILIAAGGGAMTFLSQDSTAKQIPANITKFLNTTLTTEIAKLDEETREEFGMLTPKEKLVDKAKSMTKEELINFIQNDTTIIK